MTYSWLIQIKSEVHALCKDGDDVLHELIINEQPMSEDEAKSQSKTLIKMRALKDVLNTEWSSAEAARYAIANATWLDNKLIDSARKRWGSAHYNAEKWLLGGAYLEHKNIKEWASHLSVEKELREYIEKLDNDFHAFGQINQLSVQPSQIDCRKHGFLRNNEWTYCSGVMLQSTCTEHASVAVVLSDEGSWQLMIVENSRPNQARIENWPAPPTLEDVQAFFIDTPPAEIEKLIEMK